MPRKPLDAPIVSTEWLADNLERPGVRVIDASWYLPSEGRNPWDEFEKEHIPGSVFFDLDFIADDTTDLPHMLPWPEVFSARVRRLGLGDGHRIICYDSAGLYSAARAWWMFRVMGHDDVAVLDGGLPKWKAEGRPVGSGRKAPHERHFRSRLQTPMVRTLDHMKANLDTQVEQVIDARPLGRFTGEEPEPRADLASGHIPGSKSLPHSLLLNDDHSLKSRDEIAALFEEAGIDLEKPVITTCGSGITAAVLSLGLDLIGKKDVALYDGSWAEWGSAEDVPIEQG